MRSEMALSMDEITACWALLFRGRLDHASDPSAHQGSDNFTNVQRLLSYEYVMPDVVLSIGLPLGRAIRDMIVTFVPQVETFGDDNNGRTDTGAKFAFDFLTFLQNNMSTTEARSKMSQTKSIVRHWS